MCHLPEAAIIERKARHVASAISHLAPTRFVLPIGNTESNRVEID